jgi:formylglycine-generating enzyme required for sulfatase activity
MAILLGAIRERKPIELHSGLRLRLRKSLSKRHESFYISPARQLEKAMTSSLPLRIAVLATMAFAACSRAQDVNVQMAGEQIAGPTCAALPQWSSRGAPKPCSTEDLHTWLEDLRHWRTERRIRVGYDDREYRRPELLWTQSSFVQPQMMVHDRFFYDPASRRYTVSRYLDDLNKRYGGIDSVLVWPTYPNIGIDDRNQYDLFRDLPGGTAGVKSMIDDFHHSGVRVLFPTMLWDQGTHAENVPDTDALSKELVSVGADGINGDTLAGMPRTFREASDALHHPLALEPELGLASDEMLNYNNMSWGYWRYTEFVPSISRYKWFESRHMVNVSDRWAHNHNDNLQFAFFSGVGFESWENIWGIWNQITPRDAEALRRISTIERAYASLLVSPDWEPHTLMQRYGVFASKWPGASATLWTIVNRNSYPVAGRQMTIPFQEGMRYYDLWNGVELKSTRGGDAITLEFPLEANGFGAILATSVQDHELQTLLAKMHTLAEKPLGSYSSVWTTLPQQLIAIPHTKPQAAEASRMSHIPAADFLFRVNGIELEGADDEGVDVQYDGEPTARRYHETLVHIPAFLIDTYPVTNGEFKKFIDASNYRPADDHSFLKDWKNGMYPAGWDDKPVTWVSLEDARAYASWAGKRLPHEWEWQYAAQGTDQRVYPWGNQWNRSNVPSPDKDRTMQPAANVDAHPQGASPFGVQDLVGNIWQWTDEYVDGHTRAAILRGGSHYQPQGSIWYFPQAYKLSEHGKYLLMAPSIDRSGSIGFRCVRDE